MSIALSVVEVGAGLAVWKASANPGTAKIVTRLASIGSRRLNKKKRSMILSLAQGITLGIVASPTLLKRVQLPGHDSILLTQAATARTVAKRLGKMTATSLSASLIYTRRR